MENLREIFINYRKSLRSVCGYGLTHLRWWGKIHNYSLKKPDLFNIHSFFFVSTQIAHLNCSLQDLSLLFDPYTKKNKPLTIEKYLNFVEQNQNIFGSNITQNQLKNEIESDRKLLLGKSGVLNKLKTLRNKRLDHLDTRYAGNYNQIFKKYSPHITEMEELFLLAEKIINRYSNYFDKKTYPLDMKKYVDMVVEDLIIYIEKGKKGFEEDATKINNQKQNKN